MNWLEKNAGRMQEEYSIRKEQARRATEDQIQAQQCRTEKERAKMERETIRVKAIAEAGGRAHEAKLTEDHNRRMLIERISGEREKWLVAINTTFTHIEGGFKVLLTDRSKLIMTVGGATTLAAGVYTTRALPPGLGFKAYLVGSSAESIFCHHHHSASASSSSQPVDLLPQFVARLHQSQFVDLHRSSSLVDLLPQFVARLSPRPHRPLSSSSLVPLVVL
ncbi:hypothetical protein HYC85_005513 [Camellia sinensis]|uniref:ATPase family AAA domain-containing protein n=1 Tax=Camellia sinensis TaxID=4442 RepID=A0A7J7I2D9_CAMSI|nr:hypothetical protein HYC85_005513 [Camellia sinensis]